MDPGQVEGDQSEAKEDNKRKQRDFPTSFKVVRMWNATNQTFELKMVKPDIQSGIPCIKYPTVYAKKESVQDKHALQIMHDLNHRNILSMKMFCASKDTPSSIETFVEPYKGLLWLICDPEQCLITDRIHHVPSPEFQSYLRQIVLGLDFLRQNGLYHGGLSWDSTLYNNHTVKLAGFRSKEPMSEDDAYRYDWLCFRKMLKRISDGVKQVNQSSSDDKWYFCGNLDSLINMLETLVKTLDRTSLSTIAQIVLEHVFFWNKARRVKYFAHKISLKLTDRRFMKRVMKSGIGGKSWDTDCSDDFSMLVSEMNKFRKEQIEKGEAHKDGKADDFSMLVSEMFRKEQIEKGEAHKDGKADEDEEADKRGNVGLYNGDSPGDYVRVICGAYTHSRQIDLNVDAVIRENHPTICIDVQKLLEAPDNEDSLEHANRFPVQDCSKYTTQSGGHGQGRDAAFLSGLTSQSQRGYGYPSRGMPPPQYGRDQQQGPHPPRGSGWNQSQGAVPHSDYPNSGSDSFKQTSQPFNSQPPSYPPAPGNYNSYDQFEAPGYGQPYLHNWPPAPGNYNSYDQFEAPGYGQPYLHNWPQRNFAPCPSYDYVQPPMGHQQGLYPAPGPWNYAQYGHFDESPVLYHQNQPAYGDRSGQANATYPSTHGQHHGYRTAPAAGQAGNASAPTHGQGGYIQPPANPGNASSAAGQPAHGQGGYIQPPANSGNASSAAGQPAHGQRIHPPTCKPS